MADGPMLSARAAAVAVADPACVGSVLSVALLRPASDRRLVEHVRGGSEAAFEVLFDRYHPAVLAFCRRILRSADEAEDVAQHTFLAAYRRAGRE